MTLSTTTSRPRIPGTVRPFVITIYATLGVWVPVAVVSTWTGGWVEYWLGVFFQPYFLVLYYVGVLVPFLALAAGYALLLVERASAAKASSPRPTRPYVIMMIFAAASFVFNLTGALAGRGLSRLYRAVGIDDWRVPDYFWDGFSFIQIACLACSVIAFVVATACLYVRSNSNVRVTVSVPVPVGHTTDGTPIYPVVGYTPDGQAVTADRAVGVRPSASGTNSMAMFSLIASWNFFPLAIVFGHIALSQIKRTGQSGRGLAIGGLIVGYLSLAITVVVVIAVLAAASHG